MAPDPFGIVVTYALPAASCASVDLGDAFVAYLVTALELQQPGRGCLHAERGGRMANSASYLRRELTPLLVPFVRQGATVHRRDARAYDAASCSTASLTFPSCLPHPAASRSSPHLPRQPREWSRRAGHTALELCNAALKSPDVHDTWRLRD